MDRKLIALSLVLIGSALIIATAVKEGKQVHNEERSVRKKILDDMGLDVAAIHRATDVINGRIENGEIRTFEELQEAVLTEVAFQKISIREDLQA